MAANDPILERIRKILDKDGPRELRGRYGLGDPGQVNKSQLAQPMAFISYENQDIMDATSGEIESTLPIMVDIVVDMTRDFGQGLNAVSHNTVVDLAAGRDKTFAIRDDSVVGALRKNADMSTPDGTLQLFLDVRTPTRVEFDYQNRDKALVTAEAVVHFTVLTSQLRAEFM